MNKAETWSLTEAILYARKQAKREGRTQYVAVRDDGRRFVTSDYEPKNIERVVPAPPESA